MKYGRGKKQPPLFVIGSIFNDIQYLCQTVLVSNALVI